MMRIRCQPAIHTSWGVLAVTFVLALSLLIPPAASWADGTFHGHARVERIKGDPSKGYVELYEYKAFLCPNGSGEGFSYHCGDPGTAIDPGQGCITLPWSDGRDPLPLLAGTYSLMAAYGEFFLRGKVVPDIVIRDGQQTYQDALEPIDYSAYYDRGNWDPTGSATIYQTFVATGTSIVKAAFEKADNNKGGQIRFSIHEDRGGNVETWPQIGPTRSTGRGGYAADHWVSWLAGEVPTTPGNRYAIRLVDSNSVAIQPYWCNDSFYPSGTGYRATQSNPAGHDYYIVVFSDNDGTEATLLTRTAYYNTSAGSHQRWAQSYTARGSSLAGATLAAVIDGNSEFNVVVTVHVGSPDGPQVGPTKVTPAVWIPFWRVGGVSYSRGEIPTTPGDTYWIVYERQGVGAFSAARMSDGNVYPGGTASYSDGIWHPQSFDLWMNIFEHESTGSETPTPTPVPGGNLLQNDSFETSFWTVRQPNQPIHPGWGNNTDIGVNGRFPNPGEAKDGEKWADFSYGMGSTVAHELYQTVAVTPGHSYRLAGWFDMGGSVGSATASLMWTNGAYPGKGNGVPLASMVWNPGDSHIPWTEMSANVVPTGSLMTFIVRIEIGGWGAGVNFDACSTVDQTVEPTPLPASHLLVY